MLKESVLRKNTHTLIITILFDYREDNNQYRYELNAMNDKLVIKIEFLVQLLVRISKRVKKESILAFYRISI